jgi:hypothetical protein
MPDFELAVVSVDFATDAEAVMRRHLKLLLRDWESLVVTKPDWFEEAESLP